MSTRASVTMLALLEGPGQLAGWLRQTGGHGAWIGGWSIVGFAGTVASPFLLAAPGLLMFLAPRAVFVALAAPTMPLVPFVAMGLFRLSVADGSYFVLGGRVQNQVAAFAERCRAKRWWSPSGFADRCARWICHSRLMASVVLFFRPSGRFCGVAAAYGVPAWLTGSATLAGTVTYLVAMHQGAQLLIG